MGPIQRTIREDGSFGDDFLGPNPWFMDMMFMLQSTLIGTNVWKGVLRCHRNPKYSNNKVPPGSFEELCTTSDMALSIWLFENEYDQVLKELDEDEDIQDSGLATHNPENGKWTTSNTKKFEGWSDEGKQAWNNIMVLIKERWVDIPREHSRHKNEFIELFEQRWVQAFGFGKRVSDGDSDGEEALEAESDMITDFD